MARAERFAWLLAAGFALAWCGLRAATQSITIDEATSYQLFAAPSWELCFYSSSGNHVLNSLLTRASTRLFGLSEFTLRLPALLGGAFYLAAAVALCRRLTPRPMLAWTLFACMAFNPFVMDYLVAARGYGLAIGLLLAAVWAFSVDRRALASLCLGLSFCANFSFAYVDGALAAVFAIDAARRARGWRAAIECLAPGALAAALLCGRTVWRYPRDQLYYGAQSLRESATSLLAATFDEWSPSLPDALTSLAAPLWPWLAALFVAALVWQAARVALGGPRLGRLLAYACGLALLAHWLAFRFLHVPLPLARTGLFFVPLAFLLIGIGGAQDGPLWQRRAAVAALLLCAVWFAGCLRLTHFKEWKFNADTRDLFVFLDGVRHSRGLRGVEIDWRYSASLNFYREARGARDLPEFAFTEPHKEGQPGYVVSAETHLDFVRRQRLAIVYRNRFAGTLVALRAADAASLR
jgi:hypothetical protein